MKGGKNCVVKSLCFFKMRAGPGVSTLILGQKGKKKGLLAHGKSSQAHATHTHAHTTHAPHAHMLRAYIRTHTRACHTITHVRTQGQHTRPHTRRAIPTTWPTACPQGTAGAYRGQDRGKGTTRSTQPATALAPRRRKGREARSPTAQSALRCGGVYTSHPPQG